MRALKDLPKWRQERIARDAAAANMTPEAFRRRRRSRVRQAVKAVLLLGIDAAVRQSKTDIDDALLEVALDLFESGGES